MLREKLSAVNSCCGASNEPVVSRLTWPENGVPANRFDANRADDPTVRSKNVGVSNVLASIAPLPRVSHV